MAPRRADAGPLPLCAPQGGEEERIETQLLQGTARGGPKGLPLRFGDAAPGLKAAGSLSAPNHAGQRGLRGRRVAGAAVDRTAQGSPPRVWESPNT